MSEPTRGPIGASGASDAPDTGQAVKPDENGWGATFHRHFGSNEIHRDGGPECNQPGKPRPVYVFDPDYLAEHDDDVRREAAAEQREKDAAKLNAISVQTFVSANGLDDVTWGQLMRRAAAFDDAAAAIREQGNDA